MNSLSSAAREAQRAYKKRWRANNPEKVKGAQLRYWERKGQELQQELQQEQEAKANANSHD